MKRLLSRHPASAALAGLVALATTAAPPHPARADDGTDYGQVAMYVADMLQKHHYNRKEFVDDISSRLLDGYLNFLDFSHQYFTAEDIDEFSKLYRTTLDDEILVGDISAATTIYDRFETRVKERVAKIRELLESETFTFGSDRTVMATRKEAPWPADEAAADELWRKLIEAELLQEKLRQTVGDEDEGEGEAEGVDEGGDAELETGTDSGAEEETETPEERILKRYTRFVDSLEENEEEDIVNYFLTSLASAYDPHSDWFSQSEMDNFQISMKNALVGIGALLSAKDDGTAEIQGLVINGPAQRAGELKVGDRIVGVGQGEEGPIEDTVYLRLQKVVEMIRGMKGTVVRLKVADADDLSITREISIVRDEVQLKDKLATAQLIQTTDQAGNPARLGWIELPSFYADMEERTTTAYADVRRLLERLMAEGISGLVLDLRGNGGGSLEQAVDLTGLFVKKGPVVQSKDWRDNRDHRDSRARLPVYDGPLVVLTDKASASASEILAAALQDYNRAVVVGESSTFGKGTVQTILDVKQYMPFFSEKKRAGALKVTIQKFYRIAGGSTQLRGVVPDLVLPSRRDALDIGEDALDNPLAYDEIAPLEYEKFSDTSPLTDEVAALHTARVAAEPEFEYVREDTARLQEQITKNSISLNEAARTAEVEQNKARRETRESNRKERNAKIGEDDPDRFTLYRLVLDNVDDAELVEDSEFSDRDSTGMILSEDRAQVNEFADFPYGMDPTKLEALRVLQDMIRFSSPARTAKVDEAPVSS